MIDIVYKPYVFTHSLTGNTTDYSAINSAITSGIYISSGFTFNLNGFDQNKIERLDIIDNIINYVNNGINKYMLNILIVNSVNTYTSVSSSGTYCINITYSDQISDYFIMNVIYDLLSYESLILVNNIFTTVNVVNTTTTTKYVSPTTTTTTTLPIMPIVIYMPILSSNLTGNTTNFSGASSAITSGIYISSGFTFNLNGFDQHEIGELDIIDNLINYVDGGVNKYMLDILIVNSAITYTNVVQTDIYCIEISYNGQVINYFIMNVIYDLSSYNSVITYIPNMPIIYDINYALSGSSSIRVSPVIYYNPPISGTSWLGSGTTIPYNVFLDFYHSNISGWTLDSLKILFISGITGCFYDNMSLSNIIFNLYEKGSVIPLTGITESGIYDIYISITDSFGSNITNIITNIKVDDNPPVIVYRNHYISNITGNTINFSGASSAITSGIYISSGFTFNLNGFHQNEIEILDIIDSIVNYVYDDVDVDINKYMLNVLLSSKHTDNGPILYEKVTLPGAYCVKFSLSDSSGNEIINYFMMNVIYDVSTYSEGYWQDDKVWIDSVVWLDHPIIS